MTGLHWLRAVVTAGMLASGNAWAADPGRDDIIGEVREYSAVWEDTLMDIARRHSLGYVELVSVNPGVDPWIPGVGTRIVLPTAHIIPDVPRVGIVMNLPEMRLYWFAKDGSVRTFPIGIGQDGWETPSGETTVLRKQVGPTWYPPASIRAEKPELPAMVPPGPDNPLGTHALYLGWKAYLIHGTNKPDGVGRRVSHGCIRMYPEDIVALYPAVGIGTRVRAVNQPVKTGWRGGELYLEVHATLRQIDQVEIDGTMTPDPLPVDVHAKVAAAAGDEIGRVDWETVAREAEQRSGMPVRVTRTPEASLIVVPQRGFFR